MSEEEPPARVLARAARNAVLAHHAMNEEVMLDSVKTILEYGPLGVSALIWSMCKLVLLESGAPENAQFAVEGVIAVDEHGNRSEVMSLAEDNDVPREIKDSVKMLAIAGNDDKDMIEAMVNAYWNDGYQAVADLLCAVIALAAGVAMPRFEDPQDFGFQSPN